MTPKGGSKSEKEALSNISKGGQREIGFERVNNSRRGRVDED